MAVPGAGLGLVGWYLLHLTLSPHRKELAYLASVPQSTWYTVLDESIKDDFPSLKLTELLMRSLTDTCCVIYFQIPKDVENFILHFKLVIHPIDPAITTCGWVVLRKLEDFHLLQDRLKDVSTLLQLMNAFTVSCSQVFVFMCTIVNMHVGVYACVRPSPVDTYM